LLPTAMMSQYGAQYQPYPQAYGSIPQHLEAGQPGMEKLAQKDGLSLRRRKRTSVFAICCNLFAPWILFSLLYANLTFSLHYQMPFVCWLFVAIGFLLTAGIGAVAVRNWLEAQEKQLWLSVLFLSCLLAAVAGPVLGDLNYWTNMQPYYELKTLNNYFDVNPTISHGKQMMDAGTISFASGSRLDIANAWIFQDLNKYCVAPVSFGTSTLGSYDFWAVGLNCCERRALTTDFRCGQYKNVTAGQGLRLMDERQLQFYRLAVQQAEAKHSIVAKHPIFFYWTDDASADMHSYAAMGSSYFGIGVGAFFVVQVFLIVIASIVVNKIEF